MRRRAARAVGPGFAAVDEPDQVGLLIVPAAAVDDGPPLPAGRDPAQWAVLEVAIAATGPPRRRGAEAPSRRPAAQVTDGRWAIWP